MTTMTPAPSTKPAATCDIASILGDEAESLLGYTAKGFDKASLCLPGPDFVDRVLAASDRPIAVLRNFQTLMNSGRLAGTGYVSILPVDQGVEHSAGASFAPNPAYFDPENIVKLAIEGGCNAVASTFGVLGAVARRYAHKIPFLVKFNHNELLTYPNTYDQSLFGTVQQATTWARSPWAPPSTSARRSRARQIQEVAERSPTPTPWAWSPSCGANLATRLQGQPRQPPTTTAADLTGQANHLGVTIEADIIKQKLATKNGGYAP
ncbi:MAG: hypothetical protein KatS3mg103_0573 [Phycisphaerales bacterium]|nr:MAG: hypothetical protein KatS3mg103_0573 [Phycisphaerales bacterium]